MKFWLVWLGSGVFISFIVLYFQGYFRPRPHYRLYHCPAPEAANFVVTVAGLSDSFITQGEITNFWVEADAIFQARLAAIRSAQKSIQFETYIMTPGRRADEFAQALIEQAQAGVRIQLIADDHGVKSMPSSYWQQLKQAGVAVRTFNRFCWRDPVANLQRNHRKLLLIDRRLALLGGAGISDHWDGWDKIGDTAPWLDYEISLEGPAVTRLQGLFWQHWLDTGGSVDFTEEVVDPHLEGGSTILVTHGEDPSYESSSIRSLFQTTISGAKRRIWLASPYFLPDPNSRAILLQAKARGVDVRILTMGPHCDKSFVRATSRECYGPLLSVGIPIYEYQPSMLHAKALLIDEDWVSLGSANFDPRSFFENEELNVSLSDRFLAQQVEHFFQQAFVKSHLVEYLQWQKRSLSNRLMGRFWLLFYWQL